MVNLRQKTQTYNTILREINRIETELAKLPPLKYSRRQADLNSRLFELMKQEAQLGDELELAEADGHVKWVHGGNGSYLQYVGGKHGKV